MYKNITLDISGIKYVQIVRLSDNANIPVDPGNRDYQEYLKWERENVKKELSIGDPVRQPEKRPIEIFPAQPDAKIPDGSEELPD